jgi:transcriptional regulator with XRE-family HTH domain
MVKFIEAEENLSLGKMLNQARLDKNFSVNDLSLVTKIHKRLIHSLENDEIENLPNRIYVLGFLKSLSEVLNYDLDKAIYLYEMSLLKLIESNNPEETTPDEVSGKPRFSREKWSLAVCVFFVIILMISPLFVENDDSKVKKETASKELTVKKATKAKPQKEIVMARPVVNPSSYNVSISATHGVSWISFQVDKNPVRKMTLKKGSSIILKGESVRLVLGNYKALLIKNNREVVSIKKNINGDVAKINFPQEKNDFTPAQNLIFTLENKVNDQTQRL